MRRIALVVLIVLCAEGCGGSASSGSSASSRTPRYHAPPVPVARSVCAGFRSFAAEMNRVTPKDQVALVPYAISVSRAAVQTHVSHAEFLAASDLAAWVGSASFTTEGNIYSPQYVRMQRYCS